MLACRCLLFPVLLLMSHRCSRQTPENKMHRTLHPLNGHLLVLLGPSSWSFFHLQLVGSCSLFPGSHSLCCSFGGQFGQDISDNFSFCRNSYNLGLMRASVLGSGTVVAVDLRPASASMEAILARGPEAASDSSKTASPTGPHLIWETPPGQRRPASTLQSAGVLNDWERR